MKFTDFKFRYILMALVMSMSINICAFADAEQETPAETVTEETVQELTLEEEPTEEELAQAAAEAAARERRELNEKLYNENSERLPTKPEAVLFGRGGSMSCGLCFYVLEGKTAP